MTRDYGHRCTYSLAERSYFYHRVGAGCAGKPDNCVVGTVTQAIMRGKRAHSCYQNEPVDPTDHMIVIRGKVDA